MKSPLRFVLLLCFASVALFGAKEASAQCSSNFAQPPMITPQYSSYQATPIYSYENSTIIQSGTPSYPVEYQSNYQPIQSAPSVNYSAPVQTASYSGTWPVPGVAQAYPAANSYFPNSYQPLNSGCASGNCPLNR